MDFKPWHKNYHYSVPTHIRYPQYPVQNFLHIAASHFPDKTAVSFYGRNFSFWELRIEMLRMANAMERLGVKKGERVGIALPNCPQYIITYLAVLSLGAIVVNMNPQYTYDELKFMMENTSMETLITVDTALPTFRMLVKALGCRRLIVTKTEDYKQGYGLSTAKSFDLEDGWYHFSDLLDACSDTRLPKDTFTPHDPAMIQFTGGTTGVPKGALLSHANIVASTLQCAIWLGPTVNLTPYADRTVLGIIPYFHIYGTMIAMNYSFVTGCSQILMQRFEIGEFMDQIARLKQVTFFPAVPTMITAMVNYPDAADLNLGKRFRFVNSGGAPMPTELIGRVKDMGIFFGEGWGMSETTAMGISNPLMGHRAGSIGVPVPDNDVRLVDTENGVEDVKPGDPGEILIKGPTVMKSYWNDPEETKKQITDGWLHTGDIAQADEDGYLYIVDRKKDMIIAGGFNIYPREVDEVLYQHDKIAEAVTVGVPDEYRGETVKAYVVLKPGAMVTDKEIISFCKSKLAAYKIPRIVEFRTALPKSAVGKILRKILREEEMMKRK
jgi:long-chain acyl-CoA synthetase